MSPLALFLGIALGIVVWALLRRQLTARPWLQSGAPPIGERGARAFPPPAVGLGVFLAVVASLFGLLASAYAMRMMLTDWSHLPLPPTLWLNTALLLLVSAVWQGAWFAADRRALLSLCRRVMSGCVLTALFLCGQWLVWRRLYATGLFLACSPAAAFFYLFTALHGAHVLGGMFVAARLALRTEIAVRVTPDLLLSVRLCTVYWHFLLLLWLAIFTLLLAT